MVQGLLSTPGVPAGRRTCGLESLAMLTQLVGQGQGVGGVLHGATGWGLGGSPSLLLFQRGSRQVAKLPCGVGGAPALIPAHTTPSVQAGDLAEVCKAKRGLLSGETEPLPLATGLLVGGQAALSGPALAPQCLRSRPSTGVSTCSLEAVWGPCLCTTIQQTAGGKSGVLPELCSGLES